MDVSGDNFPVIVDKIVDQLVESEQLEETDVDFVLQALYKKHKYAVTQCVLSLIHTSLYEMKTSAQEHDMGGPQACCQVS